MFEEIIFNLFYLISSIDTFDILRYYIVEFEIKGHFREVLSNLFLVNALILKDFSGMEVIDFQIVACCSNNLDSLLLPDIQGFVD